MKLLTFILFMGAVVAGSVVMYDSGSKPKTNTYNELNIPVNLTLPFNIEELKSENSLIKPFGVVTNKDEDIKFGHPGIDVPLKKDAQIIAPHNGSITNISKNPDGKGGTDIIYIFEGEYPNGEGWGFKFEHVLLKKDIQVGDTIEQGDTIATNALEDGSNSHIQYAYWLEDFKKQRDAICWTETLEKKEKNKLETYFEKYFRSNESFLESFAAFSMEGMNPYRGLLDKNVFPNGIQLCYPAGTDVRSASK